MILFFVVTYVNVMSCRITHSISTYYLSYIYLVHIPGVDIPGVNICGVNIPDVNIPGVNISFTTLAFLTLIISAYTSHLSVGSGIMLCLRGWDECLTLVSV